MGVGALTAIVFGCLLAGWGIGYFMGARVTARDINEHVATQVDALRFLGHAAASADRNLMVPWQAVDNVLVTMPHHDDRDRLQEGIES